MAGVAGAVQAADKAAPRKLVIAHRGASGYLPEHTLPAYAMAYAMGADFIELDLVMTRDHHLIALHDIHLEATTDVATAYPKRARADGRWYAADFTLAEIERLHVHKRTGPGGAPALPGRFPLGRGAFHVPTLAQAIELVQGLNTSTGCRVGLYLETKAPAFHVAEGLPLEAPLLDVLNRYGYRGPDARVFIESFDPASLERLRALGSTLPLVQLLSAGRQGRELATPEGLRRIARYANAIGPDKRLIERNGQPVDDGALVREAHALGLQVHPWTFRADQVGPGHADIEDELRAFYSRYGVDGVFSDQPDRAVPIARGDPHAAGLRACPR
ncbi:MAG TPA: glycerophosphodiester phosphodiesterase [bacterium]|nr:glycerophosphodiester phosphodiesterase [bacterium]